MRNNEIFSGKEESSILCFFQGHRLSYMISFYSFQEAMRFQGCLKAYVAFLPGIQGGMGGKRPSTPLGVIDIL